MNIGRMKLTPFAYLLAAVVGLRLFLLYWGFLYDRFLVPPGDDPASHIGIIQQMIETGRYAAAGSYPPVYHAVMAALSKIFNIDPIKLVAYTGPLLVVLPVIGVYHFAKRLFNQQVAIAAAAVLGLTAAAPLAAYGDGNYPNLIGGFLAIMALEYFVVALRERPYYNALIGTAWAMALAGVHHFSFLLFAVIMVVFLAGLVIGRWRGLEQPAYLKQTFQVVIVGALLAGLIGFYFYGRSLIVPFLSNLASGRPPSGLDSYLLTTPTVGQYAEIVGSLVWVGGMVGLIMVAVNARKLEWERRLLLIVWPAVVFGLSQTSLFGLPFRFSRELAVPFSILAGFTIGFLLDQARTTLVRIVSAGLLAGLVISSTAMLFVGPFLLPEGFNFLVRFWPEDREKIEIIRLLPSGSVIAGTPSSPYYPIFLPDHTYVVTPLPQGSDYMFIGSLPRGNPDGTAYPYYSNYEDIREKLSRFSDAATVHRFADGSEIRQVTAQRDDR